MASLEEPSEPSTFVRQSTSSQVRVVVLFSAVPSDVPLSGSVGHAKGTPRLATGGDAQFLPWSEQS
jgi:hypothetical protein